MFKCHLCSLETKQLNGLMSRHWKKHCSDSYTKERYKRDLLASHGRAPKVCPVCSKETTIPKGEKEYPQYHKKCYTQNLLSGEDNPNYRGGKKKFTCGECGKVFNKHSTMVLVEYPFCSTSCSMNFYARPENRTEAQKEHARLSTQVYILAGPNGCGKTYLASKLADKYNVVDYDKHSLNKCIEKCTEPSDKPHLLVTPMQAKRIARELREQDIRVCAVYLREDREIIVERLTKRDGQITPTLDRRIARYENLKDKIFQYYGNQQEVLEYLTLT